MSNKEVLFDFLKKQRLMTLAVSNENGPWVCSVYYYLDDDFSFYIFTSPKTKHGEIIEENNNVACNIVDSHQRVTDKKVGAQVQGKIVKVTGVEKLKWGLKMWNEANPGISNIINHRNIQKKVIGGTIYKITPSLIKFFNEELYGEDESEEFEF